MGRKLYVGGLSFETTDAELRTLFEQAGTLESAAVIIDRVSGRSKGFGFVEMETKEAAQEAIRRFNGGQLLGNTITVSEARPKKEGVGGGPRREGGRGGGR